MTTSKIIGDDEKKDEEMRFLRWVADVGNEYLGDYLSSIYSGDWSPRRSSSR